MRGGALAPLTVVPQHVAIIMDGNGRWARERGLPRLEGHRAGTANIRRTVEACAEFGIKVLTLYAFSTENWKRPPAEVRGLFALLGEVIDRETEELHRNGAQIRHLGSLADIPESLAARVRHAVEYTRGNSRLVVNVAFNYGGRAEIVHAVQRVIEAGIPADQVTEELLASHLYTASLPDPDLVIRTAGEMRLSNFLLWQAAYAEYWSTPTYWPDFGPEHLHAALYAYGARQRRFGSL
ncbi:MAG: di-trans,poly-cis-decaprenylcistransferase [Chloroflexi bacterium]|nr:di-trans,poly-cis-decaprenylcistransferase [Chloroflexota bacterium]